jgi:hypothetical protein
VRSHVDRFVLLLASRQSEFICGSLSPMLHQKERSVGLRMGGGSCRQ